MKVLVILIGRTYMLNFIIDLFVPAKWRKRKKKSNLKKALALIDTGNIHINSKNIKLFVDAVSELNIENIDVQELNRYEITYYFSVLKLISVTDYLKDQIIEPDDKLYISDYRQEKKIDTMIDWLTTPDGYYYPFVELHYTLLPMIHVLIENLEFCESYQDEGLQDYNRKLTYCLCCDILSFYEIIIKTGATSDERIAQ